MPSTAVITGLGPISAAGVGIDPLWNAMCEGRSAIRRISRFDPSGFPCQIAGELDDDAFSSAEVGPGLYFFAGYCLLSLWSTQIASGLADDR